MTGTITATFIINDCFLFQLESEVEETNSKNKEEAGRDLKQK